MSTDLIPLQNAWNHFGTGNENLKSGNNAHKKKNEKQKEKERQKKNEYKKLKRANKKQQLLEQQKAEHPTDAELDTGCVLVLEGSGV
jgi:ribosomal protein S4